MRHCIKRTVFGRDVDILVTESEAVRIVSEYRNNSTTNSEKDLNKKAFPPMPNEYVEEKNK